MYSIKINFQSIQFNNDVVNEKEKIIIIATTFPGQIRQSIIYDPKNIGKKKLSIVLKVNKDFKTLIFLFEKKNIFQFNPLIASRAIEAANFSTNNFNNIEQKTFIIYKPIRCQNDETNKSSRIAGKMTIQCIISSQSSLSNKKSPYNISKIHKGNGYSSIDENGNNGKLLLLDDEFIY